MSALNRGQGRKGGAAGLRLFGLTFDAEHFVLPRFLRWPVRVLGRLFAGHFTPPRYGMSIASGLLIGAGVVYGAVLGGHVPGYVKAATSRTGFAVDRINITGNKQTSEIDILDRLGLDGWTSMIGFDADQARVAVAELPWVKTASVRKTYPNSIDIDIVEREPFAIWQHGSQLALIERSGNSITPFVGGGQPALPLVIGFGAAEKAADFVDKIKGVPELSSRVKAYIRVAERRWDLRLENGITVKLPETGVDAALAEVLRLDREQGLLSRDIASVDMRIEDRLVIQLTPEAVTRREAALKEEAKAAKKEAGKSI